jgi:hypothetical protein
MRIQRLTGFAVILGLMLGLATACLADDLTMTKKITIGANNITAQTLIKGARERTTMDVGTGAPIVTIRQCDLKRSLTVNDKQKTYLIRPDLEEGDNSKAAAMAMMGAAPAPETGGSVTYISSVKDTGQRKNFHGYTAKHLKMTVLAQPSPKACNAVKQKYEIDGWYVDIKDQSTCQRFSPYVNDVQGCQDHVVLKQTGGVKPGLAVQETITFTNGDEQPTVITTEVTELKEAPLAAELFDTPANYKQVNSSAELYGAPSMVPQTAQAGVTPPPNSYAPPTPSPKLLNPAVMMNPVAGPAAQAAFEQRAIAQAQQMGLTSPGMTPMGGTPGMGAPQGAAPVAGPQPLGPKAAGKIRIGVAPPQAQVGQGNNAGADYSTPVRNAIVALMSGPAVEVAALDSHVPVQLQAEAQQKQCDFIVYFSVSVKHNSGGGFGKFMKIAPVIAPMAGMGGGRGGAVAGEAAGAAASAAAMSAQQQAVNQLAGFNGQIKSKDNVDVQYQLVPSGQTSPRLQNTLKGKAKSDGEDVLTPLLTQAATNILTEVTKK